MRSQLRVLQCIIVGLALASASDNKAAELEIDLKKLDAVVTDADREHWAYRPRRQDEPPAVKRSDWVRNPIDRFILAELEKHRWEPAPNASAEALLRRITLDVIGLPPTLTEREDFLAAPDGGDALERLVDRLLARPEYGERWGRHWLDLVRFAETNGYERDGAKPHVYRYRDYVIQSFNADKPYDRFLLEQLSGDELPDASSETVTALGYYRLGPWDDEPADVAEDRSDQLDDIIGTTSQVVLGLTLNCARCHQHKFDALAQVDYYRMAAIFDTLRRHQSGRSDLDAPAGNFVQLDALAQRNRQLDENAAGLQRIQTAAQEAWIKTGRSQVPAEAIAALQAKPAARSADQKKIADQYATKLAEEVAAALSPEQRQEVQRLETASQLLRQHTPELPRAYFMFEPAGPVPTTHLLIRGRANRLGPIVQPAVPRVLSTAPFEPVAGLRTSGRRLVLAKWLVDPANPLTARVIVNRVWQFHFGEGLVRSPSDFGVQGEAPTHPELLDWLAEWFVNEGWSFKKLHRLILTSHTYRMGRQSRDDYAAIDPENRRWWRSSYRRLEVEAIRDSMLAVSGRLNRQQFGPSMYLFVPQEALAGSSDPNSIWQPFNEVDASRRTIYAFTKRSLLVPMLEVLDLCDTTKSSAKRQVTSVATQALTLFNGHFVNQQAGHLADRLLDEAGPESAKQIRLAILLTLCREPQEQEQVALQAFLDSESKRIEQEASVPAESARRRALEQLCRVVLNLNEFVYPN